MIVSAYDTGIKWRDTDLERDQGETLLLIADQKEVLERRQARNVDADVEKPDCEEEFVLLERASVELLPHRHEEIPVEVADVVDSCLRVLEEEEAKFVRVFRCGRMRLDGDNLENVDLATLALATYSACESAGRRTPPFVARSSARYTAVPAAMKSR